MKIPFNGRVLLLGCGAVSQCLQPLLLKHLEMDFSKLTIMDFEDNRHRAKEFALGTIGKRDVDHGLNLLKAWLEMLEGMFKGMKSKKRGVYRAFILNVLSI